RAAIGLDGAELHALDLARDRPELAVRIDLHLNAAAGRLLDLFLVEFEELMLALVHGGAAEFHHEIGGGRRGGRRETGERERCGRGRDGVKLSGHFPPKDCWCDRAEFAPWLLKSVGRL